MKMPELSSSNPLGLALSQQSAHEQARTTVRFAEGIPGFTVLREATFATQPGIEPFFYMRAIGIADLSFVCVEPFVVCPTFSATLPDAFVESLELTSQRDAWLFSLVTLAPKSEDITANLMCPIVVNVRTYRARQLIIEDAEEYLRYRIWDHMVAPEYAEAAS